MCLCDVTRWLSKEHPDPLKGTQLWHLKKVVDAARLYIADTEPEQAHTKHGSLHAVRCFRGPTNSHERDVSILPL